MTAWLCGGLIYLYLRSVFLSALDCVVAKLLLIPMLANDQSQSHAQQRREKVVRATLLVFGKFVFSPLYGQPSVHKSQQSSHVYGFLV